MSELLSGVEFNPESLSKARKVLANNGILPDPDDKSIWWVSSSSGSKKYRVQVIRLQPADEISFVSCTCPHGSHVGGGKSRCYHVAAVLIKIKESA